jgi:hypothetical protein
LARICDTCVLTVATEMNRAEAIAGFDSPSATSRATSSSRALSSSASCAVAAAGPCWSAGGVLPSAAATARSGSQRSPAPNDRGTASHPRWRRPPPPHLVIDIPLRKHWHEAQALRIAQRPRRATAPLALAVPRIPPPMPSPPGSWPCHFGDTPSGKWRSFLRAVRRASRLLPVLPGPVNVITQALDNSRRTSLSSGPRPTKLVSSTRRFPLVRCVTAVVMTQPNLKGRTTLRCPSGSSVPVPKRPRTPRLPKGLLPPARSVDADPEALNATPPRRAGTARTCPMSRDQARLPQLARVVHRAQLTSPLVRLPGRPDQDAASMIFRLVRAARSV